MDKTMIATPPPSAGKFTNANRIWNNTTKLALTNENEPLLFYKPANHTPEHQETSLPLSVEMNPEI